MDGSCDRGSAHDSLVFRATTARRAAPILNPVRRSGGGRPGPLRVRSCLADRTGRGRVIRDGAWPLASRSGVHQPFHGCKHVGAGTCAEGHVAQVAHLFSMNKATRDWAEETRFSNARIPARRAVKVTFCEC